MLSSWLSTSLLAPSPGSQVLPLAEQNSAVVESSAPPVHYYHCFCSQLFCMLLNTWRQIHGPSQLACVTDTSWLLLFYTHALTLHVLTLLLSLLLSLLLFCNSYTPQSDAAYNHSISSPLCSPLQPISVTPAFRFVPIQWTPAPHTPHAPLNSRTTAHRSAPLK